MRTLLGLVVVVACGSPSPPPAAATGPAAPPPSANAVAAAKPARWIMLAEGRKIGTYTVTPRPDGEVGFVYDVLENGRGPHIEGSFRLGSDGLLDQYTATGHHTMGNAANESFARENGRYHWKSEADEGDADAGKPAFYVALSDGSQDPWLIPAALRAGGSLPLLPSGTLHVRKAAEVVVDSHTYSGYEVTGLSLDPSYTWFDADGSWLGYVSPGFSMVAEGRDAAIQPLLDRQQELVRARAADIAKRAAHVPPAAGIAYTHAKLLDVERGAWIADQTVVVVGDTIRAVGAKVAIPAGAEVVDLAGKALLPGLVDMHSHTGRNDGVLDIASGVTTVRDVGNDPDFLDELKAKFDSDAEVGPHIVRMGFIEGRNEKAASSKVTAETPDEARAAVEFFAKRGYDGIKIYNSVPVALVPILTAEAHKRGMLVTGHIPVHMLAHEAVDAGYDGIEHINMLFLNFFATHDTDTRDTTRFTLVGDKAASLELGSKPVRDFIAQLLAHRTVIDPTLDAFEDIYLNQPGNLAPDLAAAVARFPSQLARSFLTDGLPVTPEVHARYVASWANILAMVKALWQAHVPLVAGTDEIGGVFFQLELSLLASAGIPNAEILRMATIGAARAMKQDKAFGTISAGKRADMVVIDGDPLADIAQIRRVVSAMRSGVVFRAGPLLDAVSVAP